MNKYGRKDTRDVKEEYGYTLRWDHPVLDNGFDCRITSIWLEKDEERLLISDYEKPVHKEAYEYICDKTLNAFRSKSNASGVYDVYVTLFNIMGIKPLK